MVLEPLSQPGGGSGFSFSISITRRLYSSNLNVPAHTARGLPQLNLELV
jgi:hypothetical protein